MERLRFRWRGDTLEMKTLRRLAGLYFAKSDYGAGLKTLRTATKHFQGDDAARSAQDDCGLLSSISFSRAAPTSYRLWSN